MKTFEKFSSFNDQLTGEHEKNITGGEYSHTVKNAWGSITYYQFDNWVDGGTVTGSNGVDSGGNPVDFQWRD